MGPAPSPRHSIDRIDNEKGYTCGKCEECRQNGWMANCRWATSAEQTRNYSKNRWFTHDGKTFVLKDWAHHVGIKYATLYRRIVVYGWSFLDAISRPVSHSEVTRMQKAPYDQLIPL